ncbi:MAG: type II toxin-antitoxin system VapC family toxin [Hormoscilla sp. SP12CHS1]|nr:type II toxin-antitoxin system VapC family toxin [Hormoscilla sp. SP12CHS1]
MLPLDTNIVTAILKRNQRVEQKLKEVQVDREEVFISGITYYEIKRGLLATNATRKLLEFDGLCRRYRVLPVLNEIEVLEKASEIHAELKRQGRLLEDADILIAATAIAPGIILVSHELDMQRVTGITIEDWLES